MNTVIYHHFGKTDLRFSLIKQYEKHIANITELQALIELEEKKLNICLGKIRQFTANHKVSH